MTLQYSQNSTIRKHNKGFTLVELSIVLVVIGLLVSGILVGKDMIRAAELRAVTTEKDQIQTAVNLFKDKYQGLPGDLNNATDFWGTMPTGTCDNNAAGASGATGTQTCNGNGDTKININSAANCNSEEQLIWQHLSNAGLIEGKYTGIFTGTGGVVGQDYMSKIADMYWHAPEGGSILISDILWFEGEYGTNILRIIDKTGNLGSFTPLEAWGVDKKIDDGLPGLGKIVTREGNGVNCNNVAVSNAVAIAAIATYNLSYNAPACAIMFKNMW